MRKDTKRMKFEHEVEWLMRAQEDGKRGTGYDDKRYYGPGEEREQHFCRWCGFPTDPHRFYHDVCYAIWYPIWYEEKKLRKAK